MASVQWGDWREIDHKVNPKVDPCPLCGESLSRPDDLKKKTNRSIFGPLGIIGLSLVVFIGMSVNDAFDVWGEFGKIINLNPKPV